MEFKTPISLKKEHEELHDLLRKATQLSGKTGEAAKTVAELMHLNSINSFKNKD